MTQDQLRALAEALRRIVPHIEDILFGAPNDLDRAADYLRACADAKPVAWRYLGFSPFTQMREREYSIIRFPKGIDAYSSEKGATVEPLYLHPAPAAPQAEPKREPLSDGQLASVCLSYRHDFGLLNKDEQARLMLEARDWERAFRKEWQREPLSDEQIAKGDYVLATKWGDGDPGDHWGVGFYDRLHNGRHYVLDNGGKQIRGNGFRRVGRITPEMGRWLLSAAAMLESSPPGTVNLWTMLTGGSDDK